MPTLLPASAIARVMTHDAGTETRDALRRETKRLDIYTKLRAQGYPAIHAHRYAGHVMAVREFVAQLPDYDVSNDGAQVWEFERDGWSVTVRVDRDDTYYADGLPDGDCWSAQDIDAWKNDEWHEYVATVTVENGNASGTDSLGGIDAGDYWERSSLMSTEEQGWSVIIEHDMIENAKSDALDAFETKMRKVL